MNAIFFALIFIAFAIAGYRELTWLGPGGTELAGIIAAVVICSLLFTA